MMYALKIYSSTIFIIGASLLTSCDKRKEAIEKFNAKPEIMIISGKQKVALRTDSLRLSPSDRSSKKIKISFYDGNNNLAYVKVAVSSKNAVLSHEGRVVNDLLPINNNTLELDFENTEEELTTVTFIASDKLKAQSKAIYSILTFKNLAPVADLEYKSEDSLKYLFNASKSYDEDRNYGGQIEWYVFKIKDQEIRSRIPYITHFFTKKGEHTVELVVIDNQGLSSNPIKKIISVG